MNTKKVTRICIGILVLFVVGLGGWATVSGLKKPKKVDPFDILNTTLHEGTNITFTQSMDEIGINHVTINNTAKSATFLNNVTVSQTAVIALLGGVRKVTITGVTGVLSGDRVLLTPVGSTPIGYALADVVATANNTLEVNFTAPALALGQSFSIPCKITVFR